MLLHAPERQPELIGDRMVRSALGKMVEDLPFTLGMACDGCDEPYR
jgi:hypothetical protein